jgi:protein arginine N-methyltransferase 1
MTQRKIDMQTFDLQVMLLKDRRRMAAYARAIRRAVRPGDVVLDLGSGSGILALLAAKAGARRVYAIEQDGIIHVAEALARENGVDNRVTFLRGNFESTPVPERADVCFTEHLSNTGLVERPLRWFLGARRRLLRPGARVIPRRHRLRLQPVTHPEAARARGIARAGGVRLETFAAMAFQRPLLALEPPRRALAPPRTAFALDFQTLRRPPFPMSARLGFRVSRPGRFDGFHGWCEAELVSGVVLSSRDTSGGWPWWIPFLLPARRPAAVRRGDRIRLEIGDDGAQGYRWSAEIRRGGRTVWREEAAPELADGTLLQEAAWRRGARPALSPAQWSDLEVARLCDGRRTVAEIADQARRRRLFRGSADDVRAEVKRVLGEFNCLHHGRSGIK